ncbi:unnamed protein product, partial [Vitis vinifera]
MSLIRPADSSAPSYGESRIYQAKGSSNPSGLSTQMYSSNKQKFKHVTESNHLDSYNQQSFPESSTAELHALQANVYHPSNSGVPGGAFCPQVSCSSATAHNSYLEKILDPIDSGEDNIRLKLRELESALLNDNDEDDYYYNGGISGPEHNMNIDSEWADSIKDILLLPNSPKDSSSDSNLSYICSNKETSALTPKLVTVVEQDVNTNTAPFFPRFIEAYNYYSAVFESLDATLPRENPDRINVEKHCLARDIVNIVACEGEERIERYEVAGKWRARMTMAGFRPCPLSSSVNNSIQELLKQYCNRYKVKQEGGALHFGWEDKILIVASAWR